MKTKPTTRVPNHLYGIGLALAGAAFALAALLSAQRLGGMALPGCGLKSSCWAVANGPWGRVPGIGWPVSYLGAAWFAAIIVLWIAGRRAPDRITRWLVRIGAAISALFVAVMLIDSTICWYCMGVHAANLAFWPLVERAGAPARPTRARLVGAAAAFVGVSAVLGVLDGFAAGAARAAGERDLAGTIERLKETPAPVAGAPFTGRYRFGPERAPIRIVMFTDYQCQDCKRVEGELRRLMNSRSDMSLSIKHFPFCPDCNRHMPTNMHPNACWAARAAEAAGILDGNAGFGRLHKWLFDMGGSFTDAELNAAVASLGFNAQAFVAAMTGEETLRRVQADIEEAMTLGMRQTPFIFINGVEFKGWHAPDAVRRAVEALAATNPPALGPENDRPAGAVDKAVADWRDQPLRTLPARAASSPLGPPGARVSVVLWGDYLEPFTAEADAQIRAAVAARTDVRYEFRHFPVDQTCNPWVQTTLHPGACRAARAAESAGRLGGAAAFWRMHALLMAARDGSDAGLRAAARGAGLDPGALLAGMDAASDLVAQDAAAASQLGVTGIPMIFVNGRFVPQWRIEGANVLERLIGEAAK